MIRSSHFISLKRLHCKKKLRFGLLPIAQGVLDSGEASSEFSVKTARYKSAGSFACVYESSHPDRQDLRVCESNTGHDNFYDPATAIFQVAEYNTVIPLPT